MVSTSVTSGEVKIALTVDPYEPVPLREILTNLGSVDEHLTFQFELSQQQPSMGLLFSVPTGGEEICVDDVRLRRVIPATP